MKVRIARRLYQRSRQSDLASFAKSVIQRTQGVPEYDFLQQEAASLAAAY